jgi:hypothetical protein
MWAAKNFPLWSNCRLYQCPAKKSDPYAMGAAIAAGWKPG